MSQENFAHLMRSAMRRKKKYVKTQLRKKGKDKNILGDFYRLSQNSDFWRRFNEEIQRIKADVKADKKPVIHTRTYNFLTSHVLVCVLLPNLKRTGEFLFPDIFVSIFVEVLNFDIFFMSFSKIFFYDNSFWLVFFIQNI